MNDILPLRITLINPPPGVAFALRSGKHNLTPPSHKTEDQVTFDLTVRLGEQPDGSPNFLGPFTFGPPATRHIYINCGTSAGQADSCWTRAAKIPLSGITWPMIRKALKTPGTVLAARIPGTMKDGSPVCASVRLLEKGWTIETKT